MLAAAVALSHATTVDIVGEAWHINGRPSFKGRSWQGESLEGLLFNSRSTPICALNPRQI